MTKISMLPSMLACATLAFAGASLATVAHAQNSPAAGQYTLPQHASSQNKARRAWTPSKASTHSWSKSQSMGTATGTAMGAKGGKSQKCSQKAFAKGLWGKARKRFINKCMSTQAGADGPSMGTAMGATMGAKGGKSQKCSQKAFVKGLWGKARKRFMKKCLSK